MKRALPTAMLLIIWPSMVLAQGNVAGTWLAEGQPSMPWTFVMSVDGTAVVGTATMTGAAPVTIFDGRTDGRTVVFKAKSADGDRTVTFTGTLEGEALSFTRDVQIRAGGSPGGTGSSARLLSNGSLHGVYLARSLPQYSAKPILSSNVVIDL